VAVELTPKQTELLQKAYYLWLTTVRADGMPQPTPIWFIWENGTFLIYSMPKAQKLRNIRHNPKVALNFNRDGEGEDYVVLMGEAVIDEKAPPVHQHKAYVEKYASGIKRLNSTPEEMGGAYSVAIRVTPTHVRGE
jgi:PPOX class probable F420-dependent enzyme